MTIGTQLIYLFALAIPIACISWTVTHEKVFEGPRNYFIRQTKVNKSATLRKFFFLFTCEYCFSHYVTIAFLLITEYKLLYSDWKGYLVSGFSLVWIANLYMSIFYRVRIDIKKDKLEIDELTKKTE